MKILIILSGGMDSATALYWAKKEHDVIGCLNFQYGSKHNDKERVAFAKICEAASIKGITIELPFIGKHFKSDLLNSGGDIPEGHYEDPSMKKTVVPFRNGIMLSIAAGYAESIGAQAIVLGNHFGDHAIYPDCREDFSKAMFERIYNSKK